MNERLQIRWVKTTDEFRNHQTFKACILNRFDKPRTIAMLRVFQGGSTMYWYNSIGKFLLCESSTDGENGEWNGTVDSFKEKIENEWKNYIGELSDNNNS